MPWQILFSNNFHFVWFSWHVFHWVILLFKMFQVDWADFMTFHNIWLGIRETFRPIFRAVMFTAPNQNSTVFGFCFCSNNTILNNTNVKSYYRYYLWIISYQVWQVNIISLASQAHSHSFTERCFCLPYISTRIIKK